MFSPDVPLALPARGAPAGAPALAPFAEPAGNEADVPTAPANRKTKGRGKLIGMLFVAMVLVVGAAGYGYTRLTATDSLKFKTATVERRHIVGQVSANGTLQAIVTVQVGTAGLGSHPGTCRLQLRM